MEFLADVMRSMWTTGEHANAAHQQAREIAVRLFGPPPAPTPPKAADFARE